MPARFALLLAWSDILADQDHPGALYARFLASQPLLTDSADWPDQEGEPHPTDCRCPDCDPETSPMLDQLPDAE